MPKKAAKRKPTKKPEHFKPEVFAIWDSSGEYADFYEEIDGVASENPQLVAVYKFDRMVKLSMTKPQVIVEPA